MKRWLLILMALIFSAGCNSIEDDYSELFGQLTKDRYQFFELLDDYPSLKDGVASLEPALFNESLYRSLNLNPGAGAGFLQMLSDALLDTNPPVQNLFADLGSIMKRVRTANPSSYDTSMLYLERLRTSNYSLVYDGMPFQGSGFQDTFDTSNPSSVEDLVERTARLLQNPDPSDITDVQNSIIKILQTNATTRSATEGMFLSSLELAKSTGSSSLLQTLGQLADAMRQRAGYDNGTTARLATVTLLQNLSSYFQPGGAVYDADASYRDSEFPSDLRSQFIAIYDSVRPFLTANGAHTGSRPLLETLSEDLADLPQDVHQDADASLKKMIDLDAYGADRLNNVHSTKITALESLLFLLSLGNHFGYAWDDDPNNTNTITGATDGVITIGDVLYSLRSLIKGDPVLSLSGFLKDSQSSGLVQRNGSVLSFGINSPALALLQGQSTGSATSLADSGYTVYHRTVPYMLDWIVRVVYGGQGPYYNVNRTNGSGDYTTPDGTVYRTSGGTDLTYVSSWTTDTFRIRVKQFLSGGGSTNHYIGPGGYEDPSGNGTAFTVVESYIAPSNRALTSDEQAMYKNFQWLLYKKRFVIVIPLHAKLGASGIEHAAYVTVAANGLVGLINARPYCNIADNKCYSDDNGRWSVAGFRLQPDFQTASIRSNIGMSLNLQMSDQPADSAMFVGAYGYGLSGDDVFGYADATLYQILYDTVLFPVPPSQFHGAIPPALSANASVLERVGFLQTGMVPPSQVDANWDNRNRLLPVVTALARTLGKKTNPASAYGAFQLLGNVADAVARPYIYRGMDPESGVSGLIQYHLEGSGPSFNIRSPALTISDYGPDSNLRSLVSLLIESTRRYQDGILTLVSKTRLIEKAVQLLAATGQASVTTARNQFYDYLASFLSQENPDAILSSSTLIDLRLEAGDLADFLGQYSVGKDPAYDHDDWVHVQTSVELFGDWFGSSSPRSLVNGLDRAIQIFSQIPPTATETSAIFDSLLSVVENSGNPAVELQRMIQVQLPGLLASMKSDFYYLSGAMAGLSVDGGFFKFIHSNIFNTHALGEIYMDTERFLQSPAMQDRGDSPHSLIYAAGSLMHYFSKIRDQGTRINGPAGYWFEDHMSRGADQDPPYEWLKVLLSNK